jgi:hypothetical protein
MKTKTLILKKCQIFKRVFMLLELLQTMENNIIQKSLSIRTTTY